MSLTLFESNSGLSSIFSDNFVVMYFLLSSGKTVAIFKSSLFIKTLARKFAPLDIPIPKPNSVAILLDMLIASQSWIKTISSIKSSSMIPGMKSS